MARGGGVQTRGGGGWGGCQLLLRVLGMSRAPAPRRTRSPHSARAQRLDARPAATPRAHATPTPPPVARPAPSPADTLCLRLQTAHVAVGPGCPPADARGAAAARTRRPHPPSSRRPTQPTPSAITHRAWPHKSHRADPRPSRMRTAWQCAGMRWKGGGGHPLQDPSLCPATVSLTASTSSNGICNRQ